MKKIGDKEIDAAEAEIRRKGTAEGMPITARGYSTIFRRVCEIHNRQIDRLRKLEGR